MKNIGSPATNALKDITKQQPSLSKAFGLKNVKGVGVINNLPSMKVQSKFAKGSAGTTNIGNQIALLYSNVWYASGEFKGSLSHLIW